MSKTAQTLAISPYCPKELQQKGSGWCLNDFVLVKKLGVGGASAVYQAIYRRTNACVALKLYFKAKMTPLNAHQVQREVIIHTQLNHSNIISLVSRCLPHCLTICFAISQLATSCSASQPDL